MSDERRTATDDGHLFAPAIEIAPVQLPDKETRRQGDSADLDLPVSLSPDLLVSPLVVGASCTPDEYGHCITCSDEARPARVLSVDHATELALVAIGDTASEVDITFVDEVAPGMVLLIHGGVAIAKL